jgi:hypothetical protein
MKYLRKYIRQILLTEGMKTAAELPDDIGIIIDDDGGNISIYYAEIKDGEVGPSRGIHGGIDLGPSAPGDIEYAPCEGAYVVQNSEASSGWGPLLYDVAIEYASIKGSGLVSDRRQVSADAEYVWHTYMIGRSDVKKFQCDNEYNKLTPDDGDNINQDVAMDAKDPDAWVESPLSKRYSKSPTIIPAMKASGKLVML